MKRYASWGSDKNYRWKWRAALQDAIFAFKQRMKKPERCIHCRDFHQPHCETSQA